jgi:hypothetical protein
VRILNLVNMIQADLAIIESAKELGIKEIIEISNEQATKEGNTSQAQAARLRIASLMLTIFDEKLTELEDLELIAEEIADIYCKIKIIIDKKKGGEVNGI